MSSSVLGTKGAPLIKAKSWPLELPFQGVACMGVKSLQSCPTLCDPVDQTPLSMAFSRQEWVAMLSSKRSS